MSLLIHIGPHKTGSTYIQQRFCEERARLAEHNIVYPQAGQENLWGHHRIAQALRDPRGLEQYSQLFSKIRSEDKKYVISSEIFELASEVEIERLRKGLQGVEVNIAYFARKPRRRIPSVWQEKVAQGDDEGLPEVLARLLLDPWRSIVLNYRLVLDRFAMAFGQNSIRLFVYDNLIEGGVDIFAHMTSQMLGINVTSSGTRSVNPSMPPHLVEVLRLLNALHYQHTKSRGIELREGLLRFMAENRHYEQESEMILAQYEAEVLLSDQSCVFMAMEKHLLEGYSKRIANASEGGDLFNHYGQHGQRYYNSACALDRQLEKFIQDIYLIISASSQST